MKLSWLVSSEHVGYGDAWNIAIKVVLLLPEGSQQSVTPEVIIGKVAVGLDFGEVFWHMARNLTEVLGHSIPDGSTDEVGDNEPQLVSYK